MNKPVLKPETVYTIYMGEDGGCRCGCVGEYASRGEPIFEKRLKRFQKMWETYEPQQDDIYGDYLNISYGNNRAMTVYFKE